MHFNFICLSIALSLVYILNFVFIKTSLAHFTIPELLLQVYVLVGFILLIVLHNEHSFNIVEKIKRIKYDYIHILLLAAIMLCGTIIWMYGVGSDVNFGKIDSLALAIYLPIVTLISAYYYKTHITAVNFAGIFLIGGGIYLIHYH